MTEQSKYHDWVDRYVRDELSEDEVVEFEEQLMTDTQLQSQVEAVLVMKEALKFESEPVTDFAKHAAEVPRRNQWSSMALAASVLLAVVSTTLYWRTSVKAGHLQEEIAALQSPRTSVLNVPVDIMRSAGSSTPDVIIQKPAGYGAIVLDIELSAGFANLDSIRFSLQTDDSKPVLSWTATPNTSGRVSVVLNSETVPDGMIHLEMSDPTSKLRDSRLIEFRKQPQR